MALKTISRGTQAPLVATFAWSFDDTMVGTDGVTYSLGTDTANDIIAAAKTFDVISLPPNSVIIGGYVSAKTTFDTAGYDIKVGDSGAAERYLASTDIKTAGTTQLVPTGYVNVGGLSIRISLQSDDVCTAGAGVLVVEYVIDGRVGELARS